jgi:hypothetical protein
MLLWETQTETWDIEARKQHFIVLAQTQRTRVQRLSPKNKGVLTLYTLASRLQKQKATFNLYMVICNSIGYLTLVLRWPSTPSATWPFSRLDSLSFISLLCHPFLPAILSEHRLVCFFSSSLPCYSGVEVFVYGLYTVAIIFNGMLLHISFQLHIQWHHIANLKLAMLRAFILQKLASATNPGFLPQPYAE